MTSSRTLRLASVLILPVLAASLPVGAATVRKARTTSTVRKPVGTNNTIIALPLTPIVPLSQRQCSGRTPSGLGYSMLRPAAGTKPSESDLVLVNYIGYLAATGAVFDQGMRSPLPVNGVISGFSQGLQMMARTGVARFCIPAAMGYGAQATGPIPANADLVFQVELVDYKPAADASDPTKGQTTVPPAPKDLTPGS